MRNLRWTILRFALILSCCGEPAYPQSAATASAPPRIVAPGVTHERRDMRSPDGLPWSVHVLRVDRKAEGVQIRAAEPPGEMRRELPTEIARQEVRPGEQLLAVVNGDYDIAAPYLGISDGLSITSGHLWTTGRPTWPVMALRQNGQPLIGVPQVRMELRSGKQRWTIAALNKPLASVHGTGPRVYTREFREAVKGDQPFRAVVIGNLSPALPLRASRTIRGEVLSVFESVTEAAIPPGAVVIAERLPAGETAGRTGSLPLVPFHSSAFTPGTPVELRFELQVLKKKDIAQAIGGFPILVQNGKRTIVGEPGANLKLRHPRTAVCYNAREIIFVVVDGRQPRLSMGMTLEELGDLMVSLGCTEAMNTDGGGSSVMAITAPPAAGATNDTGEQGGVGTQQAAPLQIVNSPSDGRERGRGNAWVIVRKKK